MEWRDPKNDPPPDRTFVLVALFGGKAFNVITKEGKLWEEVEYWMPIPPLPPSSGDSGDQHG